MNAILKTQPSVLPNDQEASLARESSRLLAACIGQGDAAQLLVIDGDTRIQVPVKALRLLVDILAQMAQGNAVSVVPIHAELTTQEAADYHNVSRPYMVGLLERGELPFRKIGSHRRVLFQDLLAYEQQQRAQQEGALAELARQAQELGLDR